MSIHESDLEEQRELQFNEVLEHKQIKTVFQPIVSLRDGAVYGYEALSRRPENSAMRKPEVLFKYAGKLDKLWDLESLCRVKAIESVHDLQKQIKLFLNVNPNILHDAKFKQGFTKDYLNQYQIDPSSIIFEITERDAVNNISDFKSAVNNYKNQNYKIAIDDVGAGYSGLNMISEVHPHFIKLDINLIRNIDKDVTKQALVKSMAEYAALSNTLLIAEGIETESELLKLIDIGVHYGQGYFIQKPESAINPIDDEVLNTIVVANRGKNLFGDYKISEIYISNVCKKQPALTPTTLVCEVYDMIKENPHIPGFCVAENDEVIGVVTRSAIFKDLSGLYGYNLYAKKPITSIMSREFLSLDCCDSIEYVAKVAMYREADKIYDFVTIIKDKKYYGIVTIKDLLERVIQVKVNNAKHLNPLSGLPGNLMIDVQLEKCMYSNSRCTVIYIDINNFKSYNDVYGFGSGDRVITDLAHILTDNVPSNDFVGHIGGDDFIAVLSGGNAETVCAAIIDEFDKSVVFYYSQNDIDRGFITTKNRHGEVENFPLLSISIAGTYSDCHSNIIELSEHMAKVKCMAKQKGGSNYVIMRVEC